MKALYPIATKKLLIALSVFAGAIVMGTLLTTACCKQPEPLTVRANFRLSANNCLTPCDPAIVDLSEFAQSYRWDFGDGATSTEATPKHTYARSGTYSIKLSVTGEDGQTDDTTVTATLIVPGPSAAFAILNNNCLAPCEVSFQNQSQNAQSYRWEFGDGGTSTAESPKYTYRTGGNFSAKLTATGARNLTDSKTQTVTIQQAVPIADFIVVDDNCTAPCRVTLRNQSQNATSYSWKIVSSFASNNAAQYRTTSEVSPTQRYENAAPWLGSSQKRLTYSAELTATGPGGTRVITKTITIRPPTPEAIFTFESTRRPDGRLDVKLKNNSKNATSYEWYYGTGLTSTLETPLPYLYTGPHAVTLDVANETGKSRRQIVIDLTSVIK